MSEADRELIDRWLDGDLPPDEEVGLASRLETDAEAVAYLARRAHLHRRCGRSCSEPRCNSGHWPSRSLRHSRSRTTWPPCRALDGGRPRRPGRWQRVWLPW